VSIFNVAACGAYIYRYVLVLHDSRQQRKCIVINEQRVLEKRIHTPSHIVSVRPSLILSAHLHRCPGNWLHYVYQNFVRFRISFTGAFRAILGPIQYVPGTRAVLNGRGVKLSSQLRLEPKLKCVELYLHFPVCSYDVVLTKDGFTFTPVRYILSYSLVVTAAARSVTHVALSCVLVIHMHFRTGRRKEISNRVLHFMQLPSVGLAGQLLQVQMSDLVASYMLW